jgi:hypothetical protein
MLLDCEVSIRTISRQPLTTADICVLGLYSKADTHLGALTIADRYFTNYIGAALTLFPVDQVKQQLKSSVINDSIFENVAEVFNVLAGVLNQRGEPYLTLAQSRQEPLPLQGPMAELVEVAPNRIDLEASVEGYGKGRLAIILF